MNAPAVRFLHTSDWQLGMPAAFLARYDDAVPAEFARARLDAVERLGEVAAERGCAFIVVAGDVFDSNSPDPQQLGRAVERLRGLPVPAYLLPGNHDSLDPSSVYRRPEFAGLAEHGVHVIRDSEPIEVAEGVQLVGAPFRSRTPAADPVAAALSGLDRPAGIRILVGHGQLEGFGGEALIDARALAAAVAEGVVDYVALGDRHGTLEAAPRTWFSGSPEVTDFDDVEHDSGRVLVVDVAADAAGERTVAVEPVRVGRWAFRAVDADIASDADLDAFLARLAELPDKDRTVVKYSLRGEVTIGQKLRLDAALDRFRDLFACLYRRERTFDLAVVPGDGRLPDLGLTGVPARAAERLIAHAQSGSDGAETAARALRTLIRLAGKES